jgi:hypothetical protein
MAGTVFFDVHDPARAEAYYHVALKVAGEAGDDAAAAWVLPTSATSKPTEGLCRRRYRLFRGR